MSKFCYPEVRTRPRRCNAVIYPVRNKAFRLHDLFGERVPRLSARGLETKGSLFESRDQLLKPLNAALRGDQRRLQSSNIVGKVGGAQHVGSFSNSLRFIAGICSPSHRDAPVRWSVALSTPRHGPEQSSPAKTAPRSGTPSSSLTVDRTSRLTVVKTSEVVALEKRPLRVQINLIIDWIGEHNVGMAYRLRK